MLIPRDRRGARAALAVAIALLAPVPTWADVVVPAPFTARVHVGGEGFGGSTEVSGRGFPTTPTLAVDHTGAVYLARSGRRYSGGEFDYLTPLYRVQAAGARLTAATEARYFVMPPLNNAQVSGGRAPGRAPVHVRDVPVPDAAALRASTDPEAAAGSGAGAR